MCDVVKRTPWRGRLMAEGGDLISDVAGGDAVCAAAKIEQARPHSAAASLGEATATELFIIFVRSDAAKLTPSVWDHQVAARSSPRTRSTPLSRRHANRIEKRARRMVGDGIAYVAAARAMLPAQGAYSPEGQQFIEETLSGRRPRCGWTNRCSWP